MPPAPSRSLLLVPLLGLLWGFNWPAVRISLTEIAPWTLRAAGMTFAGLVLVAVALARGIPLAVPREQWSRLIIAGFLSIAAFNILLAFAQLMAPTSRAAILTFTMPIWATLLALPILGERFDRRRLLGLGLGISGLVCLGLPLIRSGQFSPGLALALLAALSWALGTIVTKRWPVAAPALTIAAWQLLVGGVAAGLGMLVFEGLPVPKLLSPKVAAALSFHILGAQALAYFLWFVVVARLPAGIASLGTLMVPAVGALGSVLLLGERPTATDWLGLTLVVAASGAIMIPASRKA
ncbi:DMT family transporter [Bosea sp. (in: a-proteobacteria)]|uniref:DMT family transporter n=1 Tax=Bosea sp. (in: a-proteobacteria) TaxID=1871050 RepID=UPI00086A7627|nr:DMT family transporter [Bosea sp. (in: a-proteobacteria)]MBN9437451.1 DMT family transporter [Bosea sp. (in: a-proteobacteria)]ODT51556.1 MAG: transporter [Methylobacterium sp. SCN 67-24]